MNLDTEPTVHRLKSQIIVTSENENIKVPIEDSSKCSQIVTLRHLCSIIFAMIYVYL